MAGDIVTMMRNLGHDRFAVVGHDRGTYVALRTGAGSPRRWRRISVAMDGVPIGEALDRCDARFAQAWFHWFFFAQPTPRPEHVVLRGPRLVVPQCR